MKLTYFVSGDIHSYFDNWMESLVDAGFDMQDPSHIVVICGDLFDRGSDSQDCFEFVQQLAKTNQLIYIRGNHEDLLFKCVSQLRKGATFVDTHHFKNGTVGTVAQLTGVAPYNFLTGCYTPEDLNKLDDLLNFLKQHMVDYFELGDYIFVHGWLPCDSTDPRKYNSMKSVTLADRSSWNADKWEEARWLNGMHCWNLRAVPEGKTVVCGHWHTSWGNCRFGKCIEEFPPMSRKGALNSFKPFVEPGIIAIDGCTAYSGVVNVVKFTVEEGTVTVSNLD